MRFQFTAIQEWPPLAWLARCDAGKSTVQVFHGSQVEINDDWFCEAVWDGDYASGDFDLTDIVAGSGARLRDGHVVFVSSASTVDRLNSIEDKDGAWISNSLPCLLTAATAELDPIYGKYFEEVKGIVRGIRKYQRFLTTSAGPVQLTYFENQVWDGERLSIVAKPRIERDFSSFAPYHAFLETTMNRIAANTRATERRFALQFVGTASSGYDSATATTLAKRAGCEKILCFDRSAEGEDDSGEPLVKRLGLTPITIARSTWREQPLPEIAFIASGSRGGEIFMKGAEQHLGGRVLLTGFHGDKVWAKDTKDLSEDVARGDISGLSLTEHRLIAGYINCSVPFWGVRQIRDIVHISNSEEMKPWDVPGDYSRPICRRIVEGAGVPREMFGVKKKAASSVFYKSDAFMSAASTEDYRRWLGALRKEWLRRGRIPPPLSFRTERVVRVIRKYIRMLTHNDLTRRLTHNQKAIRRFGQPLKSQPAYLRLYMFQWAMSHAKRIHYQPFWESAQHQIYAVPASTPLNVAPNSLPR